MASYGDFLSQYTDSYNKALQGYSDRTAKTTSFIDSLGKNQLDQSNRYWDQQSKASLGHAVGSGLYNTTGTDGYWGAGVDAQRAIDLQGINNNISTQKFGAYSQLLGDQSAAQERFGQGLLGYGQLGLGQQQLQENRRQFDQSQWYNQANQAYAGLRGGSGGGGGGGGSAGLGAHSPLGDMGYLDVGNGGGGGLSLFPGAAGGQSSAQYYAPGGVGNQFGGYSGGGANLFPNGGLGGGQSPMAYSTSFDPGSDFGISVSGY